jgi:hypothetical protein
MLSETIKNLLAQRKAQKIRVPVCDKPYYAFVLERHNLKAQMEARHTNLLAHIGKINRVVNDPTFKFVVWDYGNYYAVQVFEGHKNDPKSVILGLVNTNWADEHNLYIQPPMSRKRFKSLNGLDAYITWYFTENIKPQNDLLTKRNELDTVQAVLEIPIVEINETQIMKSRAVIFDVDMMVYWKKHNLLPIIKQLLNGKRYNRVRHAKKVITALNQGKVIQQDGQFIVFWNL